MFLYRHPIYIVISNSPSVHCSGPFSASIQSRSRCCNAESWLYDWYYKMKRAKMMRLIHFFPSFSFSLVLSPSPLFDFMPLYPAVSLRSGLNFFANSCSFANSYLNGTLSRQQINAYTCKYKDSSSLANTNTHTHTQRLSLRTLNLSTRTHKLFPPTHRLICTTFPPTSTYTHSQRRAVFLTPYESLSPLLQTRPAAQCDRHTAAPQPGPADASPRSLHSHLHRLCKLQSQAH